MDNARRYHLGLVFAALEGTGDLAKQAFDLESRLNVLSLSMPITAVDRSQYLVTLASYDGIGASIDLASTQLIEMIEDIEMDRGHPHWAIVRDELIAQNDEGPERFGDCFTPVTSDFLGITLKS